LGLPGCGTESTGSAGGADTEKQAPAGGGEDGSGDSGVEVPDVTGKDAETATSELEDAGLTADYDVQEPDDPSACSVTEQDVAAGEVAEDGDTVTLTVACEVPDLSGVAAPDAETQLQGFGFEVDYATEPNDPSSCNVSDEDPVAGGELDQGETVTLTVECDVPDETTEDAETAGSELDDAGFTWTYDSEPDDPSACTVDTQDPEGQAEPGFEIALTLSCDDSYGY
jgi:beta-lactam-binding protein with PASTA domain